MRNSLSVILPVFNEEFNIERVVYADIAYLRKYLDDFEVIAVDDGSTDLTGKVLCEMKAKCPELVVVSHKINKGYGFAVRTGINASNKEWVFIIDADGQFLIDDFSLFWRRRQDYDFILGYRECRSDSLYRVILGRAGNILSNYFLKNKIKDINCSFKLFRSKDLKSLYLSACGGVINFEILYRLLRKKEYKFLQLPVKHYKREKGKSTGGRLEVILRILLEGIKLFLKKT